jgi:hypothetical protein
MHHLHHDARLAAHSQAKLSIYVYVVYKRAVIFFVNKGKLDQKTEIFRHNNQQKKIINYLLRNTTKMK